MVHYVPDKTGRFSQRPHYKPEELDLTCEKLMNDFFKDGDCLDPFPVSTDDLTRMVEQAVEDLDLYADLSGYGNDVEGLTEFRIGKKPSVKISAMLAEDERRINRLRTTLMHEYGHVYFHAYLWELGTLQFDLLPHNPHANKEICKRENIIETAQTDWMEWQAGYVCGALLGPAGVFEQNVAFTVAAMRKEEENRVVRWAVVRGFHERTAAPSSEPRRQSRVQVVSLRAASMYL